MNRNDSSGSVFRVSDAAEVPLRGWLLRLKVMEGKPKLKDFKGGRLRLTAPDGEERTVDVRDFSVVGGRATQKRLERYGELDVIVSPEDARRNDRLIMSGWRALGPIRSS